MLIGYIRVSTREQNLARQEKTMQDLGVEKIFVDKCSGQSATNRPQLKEMLEFVREGDTVVVSEISRFARNTRDLLKLLDLLKNKGVLFKSLAEKIDTSTIEGEFMLTVFGAIAELEKAYILARQQEGIDVAKAEGRFKGRKPIDFDGEKFKEYYKLWKQGEMTAKEMGEKLNLKPNTFYRRVKAYEKTLQ